jgi:hypothetical protein
VLTPQPGTRTEDVFCPAGTVVVSGGYQVPAGTSTPAPQVTGDFPASPSTWEVQFQGVRLPTTVDLYALCLGSPGTLGADAFGPAPPTLAAPQPASGPAGSAVKLTGTGFEDPGTVAGSVYANGIPLSPAAVSGFSDRAATAILPAGLQGTVALAVYNSTTGLLSNSVDFTATAPASTPPPTGGGGGGGTVAPVVAAINPASGPAAGGTTVTISGSGLESPATVDFGLQAATGVTVVSPTEIQATSPPGTGTVDVTVRTAAGTSVSSAADAFTYTTAPATPPPQVTFSDVPPSYWAYGAIEQLAGRGIVSGFPDGTFRPNAPITRAEFVKMLDLTLGLKPGSGKTPFADVPPGAWFTPYVSTAVQAGIVQGLSPTTFGPNQAITREQLAVMVARALKLTGTATLHFTDDGEIDVWALRGVEEAVAAGYIAGFPNGTFQPLGTATRAQAAQVLALVLDRLAQQGGTGASGSGSGSPT